jgi:TonB-linked SusC/RagA family outer membrane protein
MEKNDPKQKHRRCFVLKKMFNIMKLTTLLLFIPLFQVAAHSYAQETRLNLKFENETLESVFSKIEQNSNFSIFYKNELIKNSKEVSGEFKDALIFEVLDQILQTENLTYSVKDKLIMIVPKVTATSESTTQQQGKKVSGKVTDSSGGYLPGVSVVIKGTTNGVITDNEGKYSLSSIPENSTLQFTFVGMKMQEVVIGGKETINVTLAEETIGLEEVVAIGYGVLRKKDLTGSISTIGAKDLKDVAVIRIDQALSGKVAGVQVKSVSGEPGVAPQIRIRGIGSISAGASPLYVVDGFPTSSIETLNPDDIESLDVLKDASATAIYGSRGSNGVIIINTKKGKEGKPTITLDTYMGWQKVSKMPLMKNALEQAQYYYDGIKNRNLDEGNDVSGPVTGWKRQVPQDVLDVLSGKNTYDQNALDAVLQVAPQKQYQITAAGGNENIKYYLSAGYLKQEGIVINSDFSRYTLRANVEAKLSKRITVRANLNPSFTDKSAIPVTGGNPDKTTTGSIVTALSVNNFYPLYDANGDYTIFSGKPAQGDFQNPVAVAKETISNQKGMQFLGNIDADYSITDFLKLKVMLGTNILNSRGMTFKPSLPAFFGEPALGTDNSSMMYSWLSEYTLNYNKVFKKHNLSGVVGFTSQDETIESNSLSSNRYPNNLVPTLSAVSGIITTGTSDKSEWSLVSYLARLNYNFDGKYYISSSIRTDGSSRFGSDRKYGIFPSTAIAWRISDENFMKNIQFLSELKLRASYGETGNNNIGNYESYATINYEKYTLGGVAIGGYSPGRLANSLLTWEKQKQINVGVDAAFVKKRVRVTIDHFKSTNTELLLNVNIPDITGFSTALKNIGEVQNTGWEFVLSTSNVSSKKFEWTTDFNLSMYKNVVTKLGPSGDPIYSGGNVTMIGQPIGMFYGWLTNGIFKTQADLSAGPIFNPGAIDRSHVGDIRFVDISGPLGKPDGIINSFDKTIMGSPYPDFYYGMTNRFSYGRISLSISLQGTQGNEILNLSRASGNSTRGRYRQYAFSNNYWKSEQDPGDGITPRPNDAPTGNVRGTYSQYWLDNGSYLRINNILLGYQLPDKIAKKMSISSLKLYFNATNPFLFTKYTAFNPDVSNSDNSLTPGNELNNYPIPKTMLIGFTLGF